MQFRHLNDKRRGAVIVYAAITLTLLVALAALTIDIGLKHDRLRHVQAAADASALSGAADMFKTWNTNHGAPGTAAAVAQSIASANGYTNGANGTVVTVNIPPATGPNVGKVGYIEVIISKQDSRMFSRMYSSSALVVQARAVARASFDKIGEGVIVLDLHQRSSLNAHGGGIMTLKGDGHTTFIVNSDDSQAAITNGSAGAQLRADEFDITGNYTTTGSSTFAKPDGTTPPAMVLGTPPTPDPLAYLPPPDKSTMPAGTSSKSNISGGGKLYTLTPGVFPGGLSYTGQESVTMQPGIYYMDRGGFKFSGQGTLTATGVMIYNDPSANSQNIDISGQGIVNMSPPTTGTYKGISVYQNRAADVDINVVGNGQFNITGTFYAANANVKISGNGDTSIGSQYISRTLDIGGNGVLNIDYTAAPHPNKRVLQLVE